MRGQLKNRRSRRPESAASPGGRQNGPPAAGGRREEAPTVGAADTLDRSTVILVFALSFFLGIPQVFSATAGSTLFVSTFGAARFALVYAGSGIIIAGIGLGLNAVLARYKTAAVLRAMVVALTVGVALVYALVWVAATGRLPGLAAPAAAVAALWVDVEYSVASLLFLTILNTLFDLRQAKRLFAAVGSGQVIAVILGGFAIPRVVPMIGIHHLPAVSVAAFAAATAVVLVLTRRLPSEPRESAAADQRGAPWNIPYVRWVFGLVVVVYVGYYLVDNAFYLSVEHRFGDQNAIAGFLGAFWAITGVANLLTKTLLAAPLLRKTSFAFTLSLPAVVIAPLVLIVVAGGGTPLVVFWAIIAVKFAERVLVNSIFVPTYFTLFQPLDTVTRDRAQSLSETLVSQLAGTGAGLLLLGVGRLFGLGALSIGLMLLPLVAIWWFVAAKTARGFRAEVQRRLGRRSVMRWQDVFDPADTLAAADPAPTGTDTASVDGASAEGASAATSPGDGAPADNDALFNAAARDAARYLAITTELRTADAAPVLVASIEALLEQRVDALLRIAADDPGTAALADVRTNLASSSRTVRALAVDTAESLLEGRRRDTLIPLIDHLERRLKLKLLSRSFPVDHKNAVEHLRDLAGSPELPQWLRDYAAVEARVRTTGGGNTAGAGATTGTAMVERVAALRKTLLFSGVAPQAVAELAQSVQECQVSSGGDIVVQGETGDSMYIILSGHAQVIRNARPIATLTDGHCFGELAALMPEERSATVRAGADCRLFRISRQDLLAFIERVPFTARQIMLVLAQRISDLMGTTVPETALRPTIPRLPSADTKRHSPDNRYAAFRANAAVQEVVDAALRDLAANAKPVVLPRGEAFAPLSWATQYLIFVAQGRLVEQTPAVGNREIGPAGWANVVSMVLNAGCKLRFEATESAVCYLIPATAGLQIAEEHISLSWWLVENLVHLQREVLSLRR